MRCSPHALGFSRNNNNRFLNKSTINWIDQLQTTNNKSRVSIQKYFCTHPNNLFNTTDPLKTILTKCQLKLTNWIITLLCKKSEMESDIIVWLLKEYKKLLRISWFHFFIKKLNLYYFNCLSSFIDAMNPTPKFKSNIFFLERNLEHPPIRPILRKSIPFHGKVRKL